MFVLGFLCAAPFWISAGFIIRHWLDLHEIPQKEPCHGGPAAHGVVGEDYGHAHHVSPNDNTDTVVTTSQQPYKAYFYPCNGGETASD